jgi:dihydrofolate reductase
MGRKTYESIGRPLPSRRSIIITRDTNYKVDGCEVVNSLEEALELSNNNCFIIGGEIYRQALDKADRLYMTTIDKEFEGDTKFPDSINGEWYESDCQEFKNDEFEYSFIQYERFAF